MEYTEAPAAARNNKNNRMREALGLGNTRHVIRDVSFLLSIFSFRTLFIENNNLFRFRPRDSSPAARSWPTEPSRIREDVDSLEEMPTKHSLSVVYKFDIILRFILNDLKPEALVSQSYSLAIIEHIACTSVLMNVFGAIILIKIVYSRICCSL